MNQEFESDRAFDVVVIGGGAAGLSAALALGRARRSVLVVDAGEPRNAPAGQVHNYLGREGIAPADLLAVGRAEVAGYGAEVMAGRAVAVETLEPELENEREIEGDDEQGAPAGAGFRVLLDDGQAVTARRLLVTTGLIDELPDVPGVAALWGHDVLYCPYCHGWEVRDQPIGVLTTSPMAVHQALMFRQWSADVTLFVHAGPAPSAEEAEQLEARGIAVVPGEVAALELHGGRLSGVRLRSGEFVARRAVVVQPRFTARAGVLAGLGLEPAEQRFGEHLVGSAVAADPFGATAVPGLWVAGNVADLRAQVITAAAAGLNTAVAINSDLIAEDTRRAVTERRRRLGLRPAN